MTVNDIEVDTDDRDSFSTNVELDVGENDITVTAELADQTETEKYTVIHEDDEE